MELNKIYLGDAKVLSKELENKSIDLIFTDPIYNNLEDYHCLAEESWRLLKDDRPLLVWGSKRSVYKYVPIFQEVGFNFVYDLTYTVIAKSFRLNYYGNLFLWSTPCLWFNKGKFKLVESIPDTFITYQNPPNKRHKWNKNLEVHLYWMKAFSKPNDMVFDPFCGSGTIMNAAKKLNRRYIGFEIEEETYKLALQNLNQIDPIYNESIKAENQTLFY